MSSSRIWSQWNAAPVNCDSLLKKAVGLRLVGDTQRGILRGLSDQGDWDNAPLCLSRSGCFDLVPPVSLWFFWYLMNIRSCNNFPLKLLHPRHPLLNRYKNLAEQTRSKSRASEVQLQYTICAIHPSWYQRGEPPRSRRRLMEALFVWCRCGLGLKSLINHGVSWWSVVTSYLYIS